MEEEGERKERKKRAEGELRRRGRTRGGSRGWKGRRGTIKKVSCFLGRAKAGQNSLIRTTGHRTLVSLIGPCT